MAPRKRRVGRVWRGRTTLRNAHAYQEHLRKETLPGLHAIDGFEGAYVLRRVEGDQIAFLVLTLWASQDAIHSFAGRDAERTVIPDGAASVLAHWDERATHYDVALTMLGADE
jgi:heme-degrading monooxygenase HmoA